MLFRWPFGNEFPKSFGPGESSNQEPIIQRLSASGLVNTEVVLVGNVAPRLAIPLTETDPHG